eukprot:scaffold44528_cov248-Skeletonema_marinoi.AAC.1
MSSRRTHIKKCLRSIFRLFNSYGALALSSIYRTGILLNLTAIASMIIIVCMLRAFSSTYHMSDVALTYMTCFHSSLFNNFSGVRYINYNCQSTLEFNNNENR